jgi:HAD superfamily hydrolase (TIGR01509 family)
MKAVIFDMNGVIILDEEYHNQAWVIFCKKYHFALTKAEFRTEVMGKRDQDTLVYLFKRNLSNEEINKYSRERYRMAKALLKGKLVLPEGLIDLLDKLQSRNIPLAIATSAIKNYTDFIMNKFGLRKYFSVIITAEDTIEGKPSPEIYLRTASKLKINPENCLVIEDSVSGIKSAKAADMKVIAITSSLSRKDLVNKADYIIDSFKDFDLNLLS